MMKGEHEQRQAIEMLCTDMLVPEDHLLRKIDAAVDFAYIYDLYLGLGRRPVLRGQRTDEHGPSGPV